MMDRTEAEVGWIYDLAEWVSYNPRTVAIGLYIVALVVVFVILARVL